MHRWIMSIRIINLRVGKNGYYDSRGSGGCIFSIVHRSKAESRGRQMCKSLLDVIPRQAFTVALQAAVNGKIIARETIRAYRKGCNSKMLWRIFPVNVNC